MRHIIAAKMFIDMINLLVSEVDSDEQAGEVKDILFESTEGQLALTSLEQKLGLTIEEAETVFCSTKLGPLEILVTGPQPVPEIPPIV